MKEAIRQAKKAALIDEVPIGCVIVYQDKIIGRGYNKRNKMDTIDGIERIRLGSLEPRIICDEFLNELKKVTKFCPHFHLSLLRAVP